MTKTVFLYPSGLVLQPVAHQLRCWVTSPSEKWLTSLSPSVSSRAFSYVASRQVIHWRKPFWNPFPACLCVLSGRLCKMGLHQKGWWLRRVTPGGAKWDLLFAAWLYSGRMLLWPYTHTSVMSPTVSASEISLFSCLVYVSVFFMHRC